MDMWFVNSPSLRPQRSSIWRRTARHVVLVAVLLAVLVPAATVPAAAVAQQTDLSELPISFPIHAPEVAAYFDEIARPGDTASVPLDRLFLLSQMEAGEKMVAFRSWTEAQSQLDDLSGSVEWIMYNPEHWELTPEDEQQDLAATVRQFSEAVHARGMRFLFAPDRQYAELYLGQVAPSVDAVMLQGQRLQHDPQTFATWVLGMVDVARKANRDIQVYVQVGATRGTAEEMYTAIETVASEIDGIAIWSMPRTLEILQEFVTMVRGAPAEATPTPEATTPPLLEPSDTPSAEIPTDTPTAPPPSPVPTTTPAIEPSPTERAKALPTETVVPPTVPVEAPETQTGQTEPLGGWVTSVLLFVGGIGVGLVLGFVLGWSLRRGS
jgi:hypothetical protein